MAKSASPHPASKWQVKAALVGALAIEFSALVIASRQGMERVRFVAPLSSDPPVGDASLVSSDPPVVAVQEPPPLTDLVPLIAPPPPAPPADDYSFQLLQPPPPKQQASATPRPIVKDSSVRSPTVEVVTPGSAGLGFTHAPRPPYPQEARRQRAVGTGKFFLAFSPAGEVIDVQVAKTTGNASLDSAAIATLRSWKCRPGAYSKIYVPVTFSP